MMQYGFSPVEEKTMTPILQLEDYLSGMLSVRMDGISAPEIVGKYLGKNFMIFMRGFTIALMVLLLDTF